MNYASSQSQTCYRDGKKKFNLGFLIFLKYSYRVPGLNLNVY